MLPQWELVQGPDLLELMNEKSAALSEQEAAFFFAQLIKAVSYMHETGFCHRDIKAENCVVNKTTMVLKVGGSSNHMHKSVMM